jgi:agmatinase
MHEYDNFLSLPPAVSDFAAAKYAVLPVPYEATVSYKAGTVRGPAAIINASWQVEKLDEEFGREFVSAGIATCKPLPQARTPAAQMRRVRQEAARIFAAGKFMLTLGGEHSISAPIVQAACDHYGPISVLQIDAHADLRQAFCGTRHSHGSVMRRILEITGRICQVGIRSYSSEELESCPAQVRKFITPAMIRRDARWIDRALRLLSDKVYVTIDIDGFDPAYAPGTGTPEPGGLDWQQVTSLLRRVCSRRQVVGADIVEVRPIPPGHQTEYLAARLAYKIIAYTQV